MILCGFINTGADDALVKSIGNNSDVDLSKALDKTKLVQVQTTVNGKHGQYTRMQWKNPSDVDPKKDKVVGGNAQAVKDSGKKSGSSGPVDISKFKFTDYKNPDAGGMNGRSTFRSTLESVSKETENAAKKVVTSYWGNTPPAKQLATEFSNINGHSSYRDLISPSSEQGLKDAKKAIAERQRELLDSVKDLDKWDGSKWVSSKSSTPATKPAQSRTNTGDLMYNGETITKVRRHGETYYKISGKKELYSTEKSAKAAIDAANKPAQQATSKKKDVPKVPSISPFKDLKQDYDKDSNETWFEGKVDGHDVRVLQENVGDNSWWNIEIDRKTVKNANGDAMSFDNFFDANDELSNALAEAKSSEKAKPAAPAGKSGKTSQSAKDKTNEIHKNSGSNDEFLKKCKDLGVEWTEVNNAGINLMRAKMALSKAIDGGLDVSSISTASAAPSAASKTANDKNTAGDKKTAPAANKKVSQASKDKVAEIHKQCGSNDAFIKKAKDLGVEWSENSNAGINLMRAKMAMSKAIENGLDVSGNSDDNDNDDSNGFFEASKKDVSSWVHDYIGNLTNQQDIDVDEVVDYIRTNHSNGQPLSDKTYAYVESSVKDSNNRVKSEYNPKNTTPPGHKKWAEVLSGLSEKTHPDDVEYMINQIDTDKHWDKIKTLLGREDNADGYPLPGKEGIKYKDASTDVKKKIINVIKNYAKER